MHKTTGTLTQMAETIIQYGGNCPFDRIYFFSPNYEQCECNCNAFMCLMEKFNASHMCYRTSYNNVRLYSDTQIHFRPAKAPVTQESYYKDVFWKGMSGDYLIFEDHTLFEYPWCRSLIPEPNQYRKMCLGEWH